MASTYDASPPAGKSAETSADYSVRPGGWARAAHRYLGRVRQCLVTWQGPSAMPLVDLPGPRLQPHCSALHGEIGQVDWGGASSAFTFQVAVQGHTFEPDRKADLSILCPESGPSLP